MNSQRKNLRKKRRIRNIICGIFCLVLLIITVVIINLLTGAVSRLIPAPKSLDHLVSQLTNSSSKDEDTETENEISEHVFTICIDAGHGGKDNGSDSNKRLEKDDNLNLAKKVAAYLKKKDINVILTRDDDTFLSLSERCAVANDADADYFVSIHRNKGDGAGVETWVYSGANEETEALATNILDELEKAGIQRDRGVKKGTQKSSSKDYYLNSHANMPSCIVELGFINNATDNQLFDDNLESYAESIGDAILETYDSYQSSHATNLNTESQTETPSEAVSETTEQPSATSASGSTSHTLNNTPVADISSLDTTTQNWGQGSNVDDQNRPVSSISFQEKYGKYNANFIGEGDHTIYLTFDEGYEYGYTASILDTLKEKKVHAVFFVTEPYAKDDAALVQRMIDEGHTVGNHSVTHPADGLPSESVEQQQFEITDNHKYIKDNFNYDMHLFRYPAGKFSEQSLAIVNNCNYKSVFWSFAYVDYDVNNQPDQTESLNKLVSKLHSGAIYLLHGESATNAAILGSFIDQARAAGYTFALFD